MRRLFHVTAWERVSLWRRISFAFTRVTILFLVVIGLGSLGHARRYQIAAKVWHWRHGYSTTVGHYTVSVPKDWVILNDDPFTMANTAPSMPKKPGFHTTAVITIILPSGNHAIGNDGVNFWLSSTKQWLQREGVQAVDEKTFDINNGTMACIRSTELRDLATRYGVRGVDVASVGCKSSDGLSVMFVGEPSDVEPFYSLLSEIRRGK